MLRKFITASLLAGCALCSMAVPAKPGLLSYPQPDGSRVSITLHGDEHGGWYESADGYVLVPGAGGALEYATLRSGKLVSTGVLAMDVALRPQSQKSMLAALPQGEILAKARTQAEERSTMARMMRRAGGSGTGLINNYPTVGSPKAMVLLVEFADVKFQTPDANAAFTQLATQNGYSYGGATGSALDYFKEQSGGIFSPDFKVFGPIQLSNGESYYGASTPMSYDLQAWKMVEDACRKLHEDQPDLDWSEFDNDGDGFVDSIFVFYAGYGQNEGAPDWTIWPHSAKLFTMYGLNIEFNGVKVDSYACTNELQGTSGLVRAGIGTFCHEYSHVLGLPDYYPTNGSGAFTPGDFEVMDHGSYNNDGNTPPNYSAFSRYSVGWLNPRVLTAPEDVTLRPVTEGEAYIIPTDKDNEYYVLENRQRSGWDSYIPGHGMLIWHVDFDATAWINNQVNNNSSHQRIDLVEADNVPTSDTRAGDPFPGTGNVRQYTSSSTPAMSPWSGYEIDMPITDIHETDGVITFKLKGGGDILAPVKALDPTNVTPVSFTANWEPGVGVYQYEVDVCLAPTLVPFVTLNVQGDTSVEVTGLEPGTQYSYVVRAVSDERKSQDSNRVVLSTLPPTFEQLTVTPMEAEDVGEDHFTARWNELAGTASYLLTVEERIPVNPVYQTVDFVKDADGKIMPEGWTSSSTTTGSLNGYYGEAAPALRLTNDADRLTTPTFDDTDINSLSFWYRGNGTGLDASLLVEALVDAKWIPVMQINPVSRTEGVVVTLSPEADVHVPQGTKAMRITFSKENNGSVFIDDVKLGYGATYDIRVLPAYDNADQGTQTSAYVEGLSPATTYYYTVRATDGNLTTRRSEEIKVTTGNAGAVDTVDMSFSLRAVDGAVEVVAAPGTRVRLYDTAGRLEATATVPTNGVVRVPAACGLHLVAPFGKLVNVVR